MFIDICLPNNNQDEFVEIAIRLGTQGLIFLNSEKTTKKHDSIDVYTGIMSTNAQKIKGNHDIVFCDIIDNPVVKNKKVHYVYGMDYKKKNFHAPTKSVNQVTIKELKDKNKMLGISFDALLQYPKQQDIFEKISFVIELCHKYNVPVFVASFATSPYRLRSSIMLRSNMNMLCKHTDLTIQSLTQLPIFLQDLS